MMHGYLAIDRQPGFSAQMLSRQVPQRIGQRATEVPQDQQTQDQKPRGSEVLAAHDLPLFARLLAAIRGCFMRFVAKFFGGHASKDEVLRTKDESRNLIRL